MKFIGVPDPNDPKSPTNDPNYVEGAVDVRGEEQHPPGAEGYSRRSRTTSRRSEIKVQNKGYLAWRDCMIGRGWGIPEPKPDAKGRLFSFSGAGAAADTRTSTPPPGEDIITSSDVQECASRGRRAVPEDSRLRAVDVRQQDGSSGS